jgi:hypothetical protein
MTYKNLLPNYSSILEYEKRGGFAPKKTSANAVWARIRIAK